MPSFDIVSEVDKQEIDNALNQARKELATRFDFKGSVAEIAYEKDKITLTAEDASRLRGLREIVIGKLAKRGVDLRNVEQVEPDISPLGHARQELKIQQGLEGEKAKEIIKAIKEAGFKVQSALQDRQIRVTGKKKDELQKARRDIGFMVGLYPEMGGEVQRAKFDNLAKAVQKGLGEPPVGLPAFQESAVPVAPAGSKTVPTSAAVPAKK